MIDDFIHKTIKTAIPPGGPASDVVQYYGQVVDFIGGVWGL